MQSTVLRMTGSCILPGQWLKRPLPDKQCRHHKRVEYGRVKAEVIKGKPQLYDQIKDCSAENE